MRDAALLAVSLRQANVTLPFTSYFTIFISKLANISWQVSFPCTSNLATALASDGLLPAVACVTVP